MMITFLIIRGYYFKIINNNPFIGKWRLIASSDKSINEKYQKNEYYITFNNDNTATLEYVTENIKKNVNYSYDSNTLTFFENNEETKLLYEFKNIKSFMVLLQGA